MSEPIIAGLKEGAEGPRFLEGLRVCMLRDSDYSTDARARKEAAALTAAGAHVTMVGVGTMVAQDLVESEWDVQLVAHPSVKAPRLGREDIWWPLRVAVNLTYTRTLEKWFEHRTSPLVSACEPLLFSAARRSRPDVVHAFNIRTLPAAMRLKKETGAKVVYDCRDLYTDVDYIDGPTKQKLRAAESAFIGQADGVVAVSKTIAEVLESRYGILRPVVVYNGPAEVVPRPTPVHRPVRLLFQGALRANRNLVALVEAMVFLRGRASLTFQGFGGVEQELREHVATLGLEDVVLFIQPAAPLEVVKSASSYDVGIVCYRGTNLNMQSAVPNKLMDYLGAGLALAVSDLPGHRSVLEDTGAAVFIDPLTPETIARDLSRLLANPACITEMKTSAVETAKQFEWSVQAEKLVTMYAGLTRGFATEVDSAHG